MKYEDIDAVNPSSLKHILTSPLHYRHALRQPRVETPAMRFGTAFHLAVLQPDVFASAYEIKPEGMNFATKEGKEWLRNASIFGRPILTTAEHETACAMALAVQNHPAARAILTPGAVEQPIVWTDAATGIACKGRPDLVTNTGLLVDLKSARDLTPRRFAAQALDLGYLFSMAMYADGLAALGRDPSEVLLLGVEKDAPFDVVPYRLDDACLDKGRDQYKRALELLKRCRDEDRWPGRADDVQVLELPAWAMDEDEGAEGLDFGGEA